MMRGRVAEASSSNEFFSRMKTSAMEGSFPKGTLLEVDPTAEPHLGDVVIVATDDNDVVVGYLERQGHEFLVRPENEQFPATAIDMRDVIGVVAQAVLSLRCTRAYN